MTGTIAADELLKPIPGDDPAGVDLRDDPRDTFYTRIREARIQHEGGAVTDDAPKVADHQMAVALAAEALATKSKDLQLAVWLADSWIHVEGFAGLLSGIELIRGLLEQYWDGLHPRVRKDDVEERIAPLEWFGSIPRHARTTYPALSVRLVPLTQSGLNWLDYNQSQQSSGDSGKITAKDFDSAFVSTSKAFYRERALEVQDCLDALESLKRVGGEKMGPAAPGFRPLREALEQVQRSVAALLARKLQAEPDAPKETSRAPGGEATPPRGAAPPEEPEFPIAAGTEPKDQGEARQHIAAAAVYLRRRDPSSAVPYLILRAWRWGELRSAAGELDTSLLAAPTTDLRTRLKKLAADEKWMEVLDLAETVMATECGRAWLDLQRYSITACEKLGYDAAARAMRSELSCLLRDYPGLASATLPDDTGAANPQTAAWLKEIGESG